MKVNTKQLFCLIAVLAILPLSAVCDDEPAAATSAAFEIDYDDYIKFHWKGEVSSSSVSYKVFPSLTELTKAGYTDSFIAIYTKTGNTPTVVQIQHLTIDGADTDYPVGSLTVTSLTASTKYYYCFVFGKSTTAPTSEEFVALYPSGDTSMTGEEFTFTTHALALTANSFTFGVGCCAQTNSTNEVFDSLASLNLDFFVQTGNMHYEAISTNNVTKYYLAYNNIFTSSKQKAFYQQTPIVYAWDEFDYGAEKSNGNSVSRPAATTAYKRFVPAANLKAAFPADDSANSGPAVTTPTTATQGYQTYDSTSTGEFGIFRSFLIGRCMFILLDLRSFKDITANDILGSNQFNWLNNQFLYASSNKDNIRQIFLISSLPWNNNKNAKTEWTPYGTTQNSVQSWIVSYINGTTSSSNIKQKVMLLGGGASMLAFDDGSNNAYGKFPVVQAGALDQTASCAGGSFSHGLVTGRQQYATVQITDDGSTNTNALCIKVSFIRNTGDPLIFYNSCDATKSVTQSTKTCPASLISTITDYVGGGSWVWFILIMVVIFIVVVFVLYKVWLVYKQRREDAANEGGEPNEYIEMSDTKKKQKNDLVL